MPAVVPRAMGRGAPQRCKSLILSPAATQTKGANVRYMMAAVPRVLRGEALGDPGNLGLRGGDGYAWLE